jgi:RpiB/LacA/LacB family sugar-phosphate isomerase
LKEELVAQLRAAGHDVVDFGANSLSPDDDYPDFVTPLGHAVATGQVERGVAICGSGVGASVCANKTPGVRAALIHDHFSARQGVANIYRAADLLIWCDGTNANIEAGPNGSLADNTILLPFTPAFRL